MSIGLVIPVIMFVALITSFSSVSLVTYPFSTPLFATFLFNTYMLKLTSNAMDTMSWSPYCVPIYEFSTTPNWLMREMVLFCRPTYVYAEKLLMTNAVGYVPAKNLVLLNVQLLQKTLLTFTPLH